MKTEKEGLPIKGQRVTKGARAPMIERLAKWLADYRLPLAAAMLLVAIVLGYFGHAEYFAATGQPASPADYFYYTLRLVNPAATPLQGPINANLQIARILAAAAVLYIAAEALLSIFRDQVQMLRVRGMKDHVVICGLGRKGLLLSDSYRAIGERVVLIESDENNPMIGHCKDRGAIVLTGNAADLQLLRKARAHRAKQVISVCGSDATNTEVAIFARQLAPEGKGKSLSCLAHIVDLHLWSLLKESEIQMGRFESFRLGFFNVNEIGARVMLYRYPPFNNLASYQDKPHIVVIGTGRMGEYLVVNSARMWRYSGSSKGGRLQITIVDRQATSLEETLRRKYPQLEKYCDLLPMDMDVNSPEFERGPFMVDANGRCNANTIYVSLGDESTSLSAAYRLWQQAMPLNVSIIVHMDVKAGLTSLLQNMGAKRESPANVHAFPLLEETCTPELIWGGSTFEILARAIHEDYLRNASLRGETPQTNKSMVRWEDLSENLRESNRNQAEHISEKMRLFGYDIAMTTDWDTKLVKFPADEVEEMAKMEHTRWANERLQAGWKFGPAKDDIRKINPTLVSWEELSEEEKDKDRNTVIGIPEFLAKAGFQLISQLKGKTG
jgi:hypothetical protein